MGERCTVEGTVQHVIFQNEENGYTVLGLLTEEGELVTVVGCIPCVAPGEKLTADGLWDLKVSRWPPNPTYTLQLLLYWRLGLHSTHPEYLRVRRLGLYNARSVTMWSVPVARIGADVVHAVEGDVIGYADGV